MTKPEPGPGAEPAAPRPHRERRVALETTLLAHGVPHSAALPLAHELEAVVRAAGAEPALVGVLHGEPVVGMTDAQLRELLAQRDLPKLNTPNLGVAIHKKRSGATTVSATMELAARAGVRLFATGGIGGVHRGWAQHLDISTDLAALARFPVAVVASGVKSILELADTREALETLGVPVVGFGTGRFPAFYLRESDADVDERFDDEADLAAFVHAELARTGRGVLVCNPIAHEHEISAASWRAWVAQAEADARAAHILGRAVTPFLLRRLHELSGGETLRANIALVKSNARLAARLAALAPD